MMFDFQKVFGPIEVKIDDRVAFQFDSWRSQYGTWRLILWKDEIQDGQVSWGSYKEFPLKLILHADEVKP